MAEYDQPEGFPWAPDGPRIQPIFKSKDAPASHIATQETGKPVWLLMKRGLYERPGHQGYTGLRVDAGRFTLDEARRMEEHSAGEVSMVHENTAAPLAPSADRGTFAEVLAQRLDEANAALSSAERRNEELVRERDSLRAGAEDVNRAMITGAAMAVSEVEDRNALKQENRTLNATIASLTGQVGELREKAAKVVEGHIYKERYRKWDFQGGNRSDDGEIVKFADRAAAAIRAIAPSPPGISTTGGDGASGREDEAAVATTPAPTLDGAERR